MLAMNDRGRLSAEQTHALQAILCKEAMPTTEEAIQRDKHECENGLAEMNTARVAWLEKQRGENTEEPDACPNISEGSFLDSLKRQREQEDAEDASYRGVMREYYKDKPFPEMSGEWEDM